MTGFAVRRGTLLGPKLRQFVKSGVLTRCSICSAEYEIYQPEPFHEKMVAQSLWLEIELRRHHRAGLPHPDEIEFPKMFYPNK
jgi:hypothetical protein